MALSVVFQFDWATDLASGNPAVTSVTGGPIPHRRNGPIVASNGADGMSAMFNLVANSPDRYFSKTGLDDSAVIVYDVFIRVKSMPGIHDVYFWGGARFAVGFQFDGGLGHYKMFFDFYTGPERHTDFVDAINRPYEWLNLRFATNKQSANHFDVDLMYRTSGASSFTSLYSASNKDMGGTNADIAQFGTPTFGGGVGGFTSAIVCRSFITAATSSSWADRTANIPGLTFPSNQTDWYFDTISGDDTAGDGSFAAPWKTFAKMMAEDTSTFQTTAPANRYAYSSDGSIYDPTAFSTRVSGDLYRQGYIRHNADRVIVAYNSGAEIIADRALQFITPGVVVAGSEGYGIPHSTGTGALTKIWHLTAVPAASWSLQAGSTNIYKATSQPVNASAWDRRRLLNNVYGTTLGVIATPGTVGYQLETTPGTCWNDDAGNLYVHPFDSLSLITAPNGTIETSLITGGGGTLFSFVADDQGLEYIDAGYTTLRDKQFNTDAIGGYPVNLSGNGTNTLFRCYLHDGSKHVVGHVGQLTNSRFLCIENVVAGGAALPATQTPMVDYSDSGGSYLNNKAYYYGNRIISPAVVPGSARFSSPDANIGQAYICHSNGGGATPFDSLVFVNENWENCQKGIDQTTLNVAEFLFENCRMPNSAGFNNTVFRRCSFNRQGSLAGTYDRCVLNFLPEGQNGSVTSAALYHSASSANVTNMTRCVLWLNANGSANWTIMDPGMVLQFVECTFYLPSGLGMIFDASTADTIRFTNCRWVLADGASHNILVGYNDGVTTANRNLAQLQTLGIAVGGDVVAPNTTTLADEIRRRSDSVLLQTAYNGGF